MHDICIRVIPFKRTWSLIKFWYQEKGLRTYRKWTWLICFCIKICLIRAQRIYINCCGTKCCLENPVVGYYFLFNRIILFSRNHANNFIGIWRLSLSSNFSSWSICNKELICMNQPLNSIHYGYHFISTIVELPFYLEWRKFWVVCGMYRARN